MARLNSFEDALLEVHQSLGLERPQSVYINQLRQLNQSSDQYGEMIATLTEEIFEALQLDADARLYASKNVLEFAAFNKDLDGYCWTFNASPQQVLWHLLAYVYVPAIARHIAFWAIDGRERDAPIDAGMPGGRFWFLPDVSTHGKATLPMKHVLDWLLDLLGTSPFKALSSSKNDDALIRKLQGWRLEGKVPKSAAEVLETFPDSWHLEFHGALQLDGLVDPIDKFDRTCKFVQRKDLTADTLQHEIPLSAKALERILADEGDNEEQEQFVVLMEQRYAIPDMALIRQRLLVARLAQDGYKRLMTFLCPGVDITSTDGAENKLIQLLAIFQQVYNLTIEAWQHNITEAAENTWFVNKIPPWDQAGLLLSIMPAHPGQNHAPLLAEQLSKRFMSLNNQAPLQDLVARDKAAAAALAEPALAYWKNECAQMGAIEKLLERVQRSAPWRALQAENNYWVIHHIAEAKHIPSKTRNLAIARLKEVATSTHEKAGFLLVALSQLLNDVEKYPTDVQQQVKALLSEAEPFLNTCWGAPLLRFKGKHALMQNQFEEASHFFEAAFDASKNQSLGKLRAELARDCWALSNMLPGFQRNKQNNYYISMLHFGSFAGGAQSWEDTAVWCDHFFWDTLYKPYPGITPIEPPLKTDKIIAKQLFEVAVEDAPQHLEQFLTRNAAYRGKRLFHPQAESMLLLLLKIRLNFVQELRQQQEEKSSLLDNLDRSIVTLLNKWPKQAKLADFKGQTPAMLAANASEYDLLKVLLPATDLGAQDYKGRTVLHAAVAGRSRRCVQAVLDVMDDVTQVTKDFEEHTALHAAVRFGAPDVVKTLVDSYPSLAVQKNALGATPRDLVLDILSDVCGWTQVMHSMGRKTGTQQDFKEILKLLESVELELA